MIGGLAGLGITCGASLAISHLMPNLPVALSPSLVATGIVISTLTGVIAGFAPAWGASRLDPVDALRYE
jgi:putative ABC transport system permease protein